MANFSPIKKVINAALDLDLANPNLAISQKESLLRERAIFLGTLDYYRVFPMRSLFVTTYATTSENGVFSWAGITPPHNDGKGNQYYEFEELLTLGNPSVKDLDHAIFLGLGHTERVSFANYSNPSIFSLQMFGWAQPGSTTYSKDVMQLLYANTFDELSTGQPMYQISPEENRVYLMNPYGIGMESFYVYFGYDTPEYCSMTKVDFLCKFISYRFIEAIIQARDGVKLDADFQISTEALQKRLEKLYEEIDSIKNHSILFQAQWS